MQTETITIQTENGPVTINKADFDAKKHKPAGEDKPKRGRPARDK